MDVAQADNEKPPCKRPKSDGCNVCGPSKTARHRDPATGRWYCMLCFHDARPDLHVMAKGESGVPYTPRCFVCFSVGNDVTESGCEAQQSASCGAARLCAACRSMGADVRCFSCWADSGTCYKCKKQRSSLTTSRTNCRLCHECGASTLALPCFFCRRNHASVRLRACSSHLCFESVPMCTDCLDVHGVDSIVCRSCYAQGWSGRCYRCREAWAQWSQSQFCAKCYNCLFCDFPHRVAIAVNVFRSLPPGEWNKRWGPAWFAEKYVGVQFAGVTLDEKMCLAIAGQVPLWSRHLQRLCGKFEGQVPLAKGLIDHIMGCRYQQEGDALISRWAGGFIQLFCMTNREQMHDGTCGCSRCYTLQVEQWESPRPEGKLCFMELIEAAASSLPKFLAIGDSINTATWGQFVVKDDYSLHWLNDYSSYFATVCDRSWDKAVALHVRCCWNSVLNSHARCASEYLCRNCGGRELPSSVLWDLWGPYPHCLHGPFSRISFTCLECHRKEESRSPCYFYCGARCAGRCETGTIAGQKITLFPRSEYEHLLFVSRKNSRRYEWEDDTESSS